MARLSRYVIVVYAIVMTTGASLATAPPAAEARGAANGRIAFQRVFFGRTSIAIFTVNQDGTGLRQVTHPRRGVETGRVDWSPDGRWIAYMWTPLEEPRRPRIFVIRPNGTDRADLTKGHCRPSVCHGEEDPAWSPDGDHIAFVRSIGDTPSIFVMLSDGTHRRQVLTPPPDRFVDSAPAWSPAGTRLVFARSDDTRGATALFTVRLDGANVRRITPWRLDGLNRPDWSPDGRWILFQRPLGRNQTTQLCLIHPSGTGFRRITHTPNYWWTWGAFSPDGTMITAVRAPGEASENDVYVMNLDRTGLMSVSGSLSTGQAEGLPDWGAQR